MKNKKTKSLKWKLISIMLFYWVLPFLVIIGTIGMYMLTSEKNNQMERLVSQMELNLETSGERLSGLIADSRQATYDKVLYEKYRQYKRGVNSKQAFVNEVQSYLDSQYSHKKNNIFTALMLLENPEHMRYTSYNFNIGGRFSKVQDFFEEDSREVLHMAETLDTAIGFIKCGQSLYLVRNMVDRDFKPWGVLISQVNTNYCFEPIISSGRDFSVRLDLNGQHVISTDREKKGWEEASGIKAGRKGDYLFRGNSIYIFCGAKENDFDLSVIFRTTPKEFFTPLYGYMLVVLVMVFLLIPMLFLFLRLSRKYLSRPVEELMECAGEIEKGNLGCQAEEYTGSREFEFLRESMNRMSRQLKYQFDHIYEEELALRDAKIMALQSHINPHFMNNTLEIINWEARLSGNEKVSKMIAALSTLLDAAIDRKRLPEIKLSQEMEYVNAYLYITSERLGKRLVIEKELPEEIMALLVPRLIMQPIIENAIEHGIVPGGGGCVRICGRREEEYLYLEVINDGDFTKEDEEKVARLLAPGYDTSRESSGSMGIANVNQRLRILYGEKAGLEIKKYEEGKTISILTILVAD